MYLTLIGSSRPYISDVWYNLEYCACWCGIFSHCHCLFLWTPTDLSWSGLYGTSFYHACFHWSPLPCLLLIFRLFFSTQSLVICLQNWQQSVVLCFSDWYCSWIVVMELGIWCMLQPMPLSVPFYFLWIVAHRALVTLHRSCPLPCLHHQQFLSSTLSLLHSFTFWVFLWHYCSLQEPSVM